MKARMVERVDEAVTKLWDESTRLRLQYEMRETADEREKLKVVVERTSVSLFDSSTYFTLFFPQFAAFLTSSSSPAPPPNPILLSPRCEAAPSLLRAPRLFFSRSRRTLPLPSSPSSSPPSSPSFSRTLTPLSCAQLSTLLLQKQRNDRFSSPFRLLCRASPLRQVPFSP